MTVTERDIHAVLGETDPRTVSRILAAAPSREELQEAACAEAGELSFGEGPHPFGTERVEQVREILAELASVETGEMAISGAKPAVEVAPR
ncbi:hypothetical protein BH11MYX1_BH11MYX1_21110 [soil metagenome]